MILKRQFFLWCLLCQVFLVRSQNENTTNIDTSFFQPKWMSTPLSVTEYRNGKSLNECTDVFKFFYVNKPQYYVQEINGVQTYFYNQRAILTDDLDTLAPRGYRIAKKSDFIQLMNGSNRNFIKKIEFNGWIDQGFYSDNDINYIWTSDQENEEKGYVFSLTKNPNLSYDISTIPSDYGCQVYCIENIEESVKDSIFEYKKILPNVYSDLIISLFTIVKNQDKQIKNVNYTVSGSIKHNKQEAVVGTIENVDLGLLIEKQIKPLLTQRINDVKVVPYYHGIELSAASNFKIFISKEVNSLPENYFSIMALKSYRNIEHKHVNFAQNNDFKSTMRSFSYRVEDDEDFLYTEKSMYIEKFNSKGPIYSLASVLPGLGLRSIAKGNLEDKFFLRRGLIISSISLGGIAIASKLYSIYRYNLYRKDVYASYATKNYKQADLSQKVFIASGLAYCVLGAIDFTWTFSIGCKNKYVERQLNKAIIIDPTSLVVK